MAELGAGAPVPPTGMVRRGLDSGAAIAGLDGLRIDRRYRSPAYLRRPFAAFLAAHDRGIYWLQAPAHVGKTMFALGLAEPELGDAPIAPDLAPGAAIAAFYCKSEYREGRNTFLNGLAEALKTALDLRKDSNQVFPSPLDVTQATDPRAAFIAWLDAWRVLAGDRSRRLLVIVDGLDETDPPSGDSLLLLSPRAAALAPGLYLLLISRAVKDADCPPWLADALTPVVEDGAAQVPEPIAVDNEGYRALMRDYARERLDFDRSAQRTVEIDDLIRRADDRFVFSAFLLSNAAPAYRRRCPKTPRRRARRFTSVFCMGWGPAMALSGLIHYSPFWPAWRPVSLRTRGSWVPER